MHGSNYSPETDGEAGTTARELANAMHAESVALWNRLWHEAGERPDFPQREAIEQVQGILNSIAWPES
jgi:hypothetical protein